MVSLSNIWSLLNVVRKYHFGHVCTLFRGKLNHIQCSEKRCRLRKKAEFSVMGSLPGYLVFCSCTALHQQPSLRSIDSYWWCFVMNVEDYWMLSVTLILWNVRVCCEERDEIFHFGPWISAGIRCFPNIIQRNHIFFSSSFGNELQCFTKQRTNSLIQDIVFFEALIILYFVTTCMSAATLKKSGQKS